MAALELERMQWKRNRSFNKDITSNMFKVAAKQTESINLISLDIQEKYCSS
jgi:hypothetical protein